MSNRVRISAVAKEDAVITQDPQITSTCNRLNGNRRDVISITLLYLRQKLAKHSF
jgi:hypothetical protein